MLLADYVLDQVHARVRSESGRCTLESMPLQASIGPCAVLCERMSREKTSLPLCKGRLLGLHPAPILVAPRQVGEPAYFLSVPTPIARLVVVGFMLPMIFRRVGS